MQLRYATVTGVARDDLEDEGSWLYAETIRQIHQQSPGTGVEILVPDFSGNPDHLQLVFDAKPQVFAHNLETVPRIFKQIRPAFRYDRSLDVITQGRNAGLVTKSNLILGMGETREEITEALVDLHAAGTDIITITQYLRPTKRHHPVERWVKPQEFVELAQEAEEMGFLGVLSGPLVRSSYRAGRLWAASMMKKGYEIPENLRHLADAAERDGFAQGVHG
jgi:lipoic acid synthetase